MAKRLILHHYDFSNFSEKVRLVLGLKGLSWDSVEIPSTQPKPDYTPLTGGYRRTPALQIGADVYCDTHLIAEVLEARHPNPSIYPGEPERAWALTEALSPWAEAHFLWPLALYVTGVNARRFPASFHRDRALLHGKPPPTLEQVERAAYKNLDQFRPQLAWIEGLLSGERAFLLGDAPGLVDFVVYHPLFLLERIGGDTALLKGYPELLAWKTRVEAVGNGKPAAISASEALDRAKNAVAAPCEPTSSGASNVEVGDSVGISPRDDSSAPSVGTLLAVDEQRISLCHQNDRVGEVAVHFPRVGYQLRRIER